MVWGEGCTVGGWGSNEVGRADVDRDFIAARKLRFNANCKF